MPTDDLETVRTDKPTAEADEWRTATFVEASDADGRVRRCRLTDRPLVVGRAVSADLYLDDPSISRRHAELTPGPGGWAIRDLGSRNGTRVGGREVGGSPTAVGPDDRIEVGGVVLSIRLPAAAGGGGHGGRGAAVPLRDDLRTAILGLADVPPPTVAARHLTTLLDLGQALLATPDSAGRLRSLCRHLTDPSFGGRYAAVLRLRPDEPDTAERLCEAGPDASAPDGPYLSRGALRAAAERGEAVLAGNYPGRTFDLAVSVDASVMPVSVIACPMSAGGAAGGSGPTEPVELLYVVLPPEFGTGEWLALAALAVRQHQQAESAWASRRQAVLHAAFDRELERAREIQMRLLPPNVGPETGVEAAVGFVPCRAVGGDYVDVVPMPDGRVLLAVADVCGKGLAAALVTAGLHTMVRASAAAGLGLCTLMDNLNRHLCQTLPGDSFVTMFAAVLDPATGRLECANAGHPPPFVVPADGGPARPLDVDSSFPLGLDTAPVACGTHDLARGDGIALYTDGLSELTGTDGNMIRVAGVGRLVEAAWRPTGTTARAAADELSRLLDALRGDGPAADDRTFLLARQT